MGTLKPQPSSRAIKMPRSSIRRIFAAAKDVEAQGHTVIPLHIGDPDFNMPRRMIDAISKAMNDGFTHYGPVAGFPQLREAIARHLTVMHGLSDGEITADHIVCSQGATQALNSDFQFSCQSGEGALLPMVYFPNYIQQLSLAGIAPHFYPMDERFQPVIDKLEENVDANTRVMLINTPSNPTGALFPPETIRALYEFARRHNLWIISDEAYCDYVFEGEYLSPVKLDMEYPVNERRVLGIYSFSKSFAATGLRMGWTVCPSVEAAMQLGLMNEPFMGSLTAPLQFGMIAGLSENDTAERRASLNKRRKVCAEILNENGFPVEPVAGGMFYFLDISATGLNGDEFADALLNEEHVAVVPGSGFGLVPDASGDRLVPNGLAKRCIRLCFGVPEEKVIEGVKRMARFIAKRIN